MSVRERKRQRKGEIKNKCERKDINIKTSEKGICEKEKNNKKLNFRSLSVIFNNNNNNNNGTKITRKKK